VVMVVVEDMMTAAMVVVEGMMTAAMVVVVGGMMTVAMVAVVERMVVAAMEIGTKDALGILRRYQILEWGVLIATITKGIT